MNCRKATGVWNFHGREHEVNFDTNEEKVTIEVQDVETADQWRSSFLPKQIEDLTRKTGNYKHITVFLIMLESAVLKSSESVSLELLTYNDLENLRHSRNLTTLSTKPSLTSIIQSKRYLILTYSTEFDRIHYPLALPYVGKPDPVELQETVRHLQQELDKYKNKTTHRSSSSFIRLQKKYDTLLVEKEELERLLEDIQQDMVEDCTLDGKIDNTSLRNVIHKLEEDQLKEKTKFQRIISKKNEEIKALLAEVDDLRSSERLLNTRVKSLTNEIAMMRRQSPTVTRGHKNNYARVGCGQRDGIRSSPSVQNYYTRKRSSSVENCVSNMRTHSTGSLKNRSRTPSPKGYQRFNPTDYIENKRRLQNEIDSKLRRHRSRSSSTGSIVRYPCKTTPSSSYKSQTRKINLRTTRSRTSSVESGRSSRHMSSVESVNGSILNDSVNSRLSRNERKVQESRGKRYHQNGSSTPKVSTTIRKKQRHNNSNQMDRSIEIKEIDARLNALQQYMKKSLERKR